MDDRKSVTNEANDPQAVASPVAKKERSDSESLPDLKLRAERSKLVAETIKIRRETAMLRQAHKLELIKTGGGGLTALVAVVGILLTLRAQRIAQTESEQRRTDEQFATLVKDFGSSSTASRLSAVTSLAVLLSSAYPTYRDRVATLLAAGVRLESDETVRLATRRSLVAYASPATVQALRAENLVVQEQIAARLAAIRYEVASMDAPFGILLKKECTAESDTQARAGAAADSLLRVLERDLRWNATTLVESLNAMHTVRDLNLSGVVLSLDSVEADPVVGFGGHSVRNVTQPVEGLTLKNVDLSRAKLSWLTFRNATFDNVKLDSATLAFTQFEGGRFSGSAFAFRWWTLVGACAYPAPPRWRHAVIRSMRAFEPATDPPRQRLGETTVARFLFENATWTLPKATYFEWKPPLPLSGNNQSYPKL